MHNQEGPQEQEFESCSTCVETDVNRQKKKPQTCIPPCWKNPTGYRILKTLSDMRYDYEGEITEALNTITLIWCYIKRNRLIYRREKGNTSLYLNIKFFVCFHL